MAGKIRTAIATVIATLFIVSNAKTQVKLPQNQLDRAYAPQRLALVVGINQFQDPVWKDLEFAEKDARDMARKLRDPEIGYFDHVTLLTGPEKTTRQRIRQAFQKIENMNTSPDDIVIIYFSTHGTLARDKEHRLHQYLVTFDTEFENVTQTALDLEKLIRSFNNLTSERKVLMMASCHSGMGKSELPPEIREELEHTKSGFLVKPVEFASRASVIIGACGWGETAREDSELKNDIYTHFFLEGMIKGDRNRDGAVSISEAHDYAQRQTYYFTHGEQRPFARSDILGADPVILSGKVRRQGKPVVYSYGDRLAGSVLSVDGAEKGSLPNGYAEDAGWSRIEAYAPGSGQDLYTGLIYLRRGERLDLDRVISARAEPSVGLTGAFRMMGSEELQEDVLPSTYFYGMAYRKGAFPFANTTSRLEANYGTARWEAEVDSGEADVAASVLQLSTALVFPYSTDLGTWFAGPVAGAIMMRKHIDYFDSQMEEEKRDSGTPFPGIMLGARFEIENDLIMEIANQTTWNRFKVDDMYESSLANQVSLTLYFNPAAFAARK
ncbi:MAG: caspase family protein [bacterium]